ncbi:MAG: tRNA (cytosine(32)/uridine(32)-2'-O)-methyltransferase TrmJ [Pseudomonadota bacterium]
MPENIRIVLVNTSHPGNIGSAARAMKTMGLSSLYLVAPEKFPNKQADALAVGAADILASATVVATVEEAIADCEMVVGTSTRNRKIPWPILTPREFAEKVQERPAKTAILFGREDSGLTNEELHLCHYHIQIPANPAFSSLNLAAAVQVIAYELHVSATKPCESEEWDFAWATTQQMEGFYEHLERVLMAINFLDPTNPRQLMTRLRRLYLRAHPDVMELNILRGVLSAVEKVRG